MASMHISPEQLFDSFPEPAFLFRKGLVRYTNAAAQRVFPGLKAGESMPETLIPLLGEVAQPTVLLTRMEGTDWRVSVQETDEGFLALLRPISAEEVPFRAEGLSLHLRQQTAALSAALQRLFHGRALTEEKYGQYLATANQGLYRLMRMADHLDFIGSGPELSFTPVDIDLAGLCLEVADGMEDLCRGSGYGFTYECELMSLITGGDDAQLRRMLLALLSNAMKAAGPEGNFGMRLVKRGNHATITVWDSGPGLAAGHMSLLFGGEARKLPGLEAGEGMGLGLAAVQRIAGAHGGTVMLESRADDGLRAIVSLPIRSGEGGLALRTPRAVYSSEHFSDLLVEFSDLLPARFYGPDTME